MLDPRVRRTLQDYQMGRCDLEAAAQALLQVRRDTGCLELFAPAAASDAQRRLVARYTELVRDSVGG